MSEWISVKDKMPDENYPILFVIAERGSDSPRVVKGLRSYDGDDWWWCDEDGEFDDNGNDPGFSTVTHWMPLPEPPKP